MSTRKIINVSNRLPLKLSNEDGHYSFRQSEGGLATGLSSIVGQGNNIWIGWPGAAVPDSDQEYVTVALEQHNLLPVFLSELEIHNFYEGFSNETIWPLFHYFPSYSKYSEDYWESYVAVNRKFANKVLETATARDTIWIHDYQLMLVPAMVKAIAPKMTIGYFQHIPFPDFEVFRAMPWKETIIEGVLGADLIGFQTPTDCKHFIDTAEKTTGLSANGNTLRYENRSVTVRDFPIGIDYSRFENLANHNETHVQIANITRHIHTTIAISVDRLDYSKGILQRLQAFELFLSQHPEWHKRITLIHLIVPSRDTVANYRELKDNMNRLISEINGKYADLGWQPIVHFYRSFTPHQLSALYCAADVALVTPIRDGMNLVCKEYIASKSQRNGVLILGEAAGAAATLTDALIVNPNDIRDFAEKIFQALSMPEDERNQRMKSLQEMVKHADIFRWAADFINLLADARSAGIPRQRSVGLLPVGKSTVEPDNLPVAS